jgi:hypothetical protein
VESWWSVGVGLRLGKHEGHVMVRGAHRLHCGFLPGTRPLDASYLVVELSSLLS